MWGVWRGDVVGGSGRVGEEGTKMACVPTQIPWMNRSLFLYQLPVFLVAM